MSLVTRAALHPPVASPGLVSGVCLFFFVLCSGPSLAGIDHVVSRDDSGIWNRSVQQGLIYTLIGGEIAGALWEGGETRLGKTFWRGSHSAPGPAGSRIPATARSS